MVINVTLTALVVPIAKPVPPSGIEHWAKFMLELCGVDVAGTEAVIAELRQAEQERLEAEIAKVDEETRALAERRTALLEQLRGGGRGHSTGGDIGDVLDPSTRQIVEVTA